MKKKISNYLLFVILLFLLILYLFLKDNYKSIISALASVNIFYIIISVILVFLSKFLVGVITYHLAKEKGKKVSLLKMVHISGIYPFFAGITPGALGGEAFEIFYLKSLKIPLGKATNIVMDKYIIYQITLIIVNLLAVILNYFTKIISYNSFICVIISISFIYNAFMFGSSCLLVYNKKIKNFVLTKGFNFLGKIKLIRDKEKAKDKLNNFLDNFNKSALELKNNKALFIKLVIINIFSLILIIIAAYPILLSFNNKSISLVNIFIIFTYLKMIAMFIATPGNSGVSEYTFVYLIGDILEEDMLVAYMLLWRFVTYYIPLIIGGILALTWKGKNKNEEINSF